MTSDTGGSESATARCVDCGREVAQGDVFRVLRTDRAGLRHVVCRDCGDRRHTEIKPTPLQVQRTPPPRSALGKRLEQPKPQGSD